MSILLGLCLLSLLQVGFSRDQQEHVDCSNPRNWCKNKETASKCGVMEYCSSYGTQNVKNKVDAEPVKVALYYESLCPGCREFLTHQLYPAYKKLYSTGILDITLVPYGNAYGKWRGLGQFGLRPTEVKEVSDETGEAFSCCRATEEKKHGQKYKFNCQHGPQECVGNLIETCAIHILGNLTEYFPFIYCIESKTVSESTAKLCAEQLKIEYDHIDKCVKGPKGNILEHQMAVKTNALEPPHQYVPWITVNGKHNNKIQNGMQSNALNYICKAYQGTKPAACNEADKNLNVCYRN